MKKRKEGDAPQEPVLSKHEVPEELLDLTIQEDVVVTPPVIVIDDKKPKKDK